eukprot:TRINITY_DN22099_c0_g1_i1.p1 TRINITY_DN22099_c0_g1~~TRINITY_DN22099_c0_g1_i1.p1  ORF type:complete len:481 (+),score=97.44 TRINITY_DN22099_c0_g1_i1:137-1579(+)
MQTGAFSAVRRRLWLLLVLPAAQSWRTSGYLPVGEHLDFGEYVGKFCFDFDREAFKEHIDVGRVDYEVEGIATGRHTDSAPGFGMLDPRGRLYMLIFDDERDHWKAIRGEWDSADCESKLAAASIVEPLNLHAREGGAPARLRASIDISEHIRSRFWYFTFVGCDITVTEPISYSIHAVNTRLDMQAEFGMDHWGVLALQVNFTLIFLGLAATTHFAALRQAAGPSAYRSRPLLRLLVFSLAASAAQCAAYAVHYAVFAADGYGSPLIEVLGTLSGAVSRGAVSILYFLIACGWALFTSTEHEGHRKLLFGGCGLVSVLSAGCQIHGAYFHDTSTTLYLYESTPGGLILGMNIVMFAIGAGAMRRTYVREDIRELRELYFSVTLAYGVYFLALPLSAVLATVVAPEWRFKTVTLAELLARAIAYGSLMFCLWPSKLDVLLKSRLDEDEFSLKAYDEEQEQHQLNAPLSGDARAPDADVRE